MTGVERRNARIASVQRAEIERLASDAAFAAACGQTDHFSRIGQWPAARPNARILELGCGPGRYVALLSSLGCVVTGADPHSFDNWSLIQQHRTVDLRSGVHAEALPFPDASFDGVACLGALLYFKDPARAMAEIRRVLKPNGHLLLRTVNRRNPYTLLRGLPLDPASKNLYTQEELASLLRASGFAVGLEFSYGFYSPVFPNYWWYLVNGTISIPLQQRISALTPAGLRTNLVVFAQAE